MSLNPLQLLEASVPVGSQLFRVPREQKELRGSFRQDSVLLPSQPLAPSPLVVNGLTISSALASGVKATELHLETGKIKQLDEGLFLKRRPDGSIEVYVSEDV